MDYRDFEQYNGQELDAFLVVDNKGYLTDECHVGDVKVRVRYEEDMPEADVRLENGVLVGHAVTEDYVHYVFTASNTEWT